MLLKEAARKKIATFIFDLLVMALAIVVYGTPNHRLGVPMEGWVAQEAVIRQLNLREGEE